MSLMIKGNLLGVLTDVNTGKTRTFEAENHIQDSLYPIGVNTSYPPAIRTVDNIFVSTRDMQRPRVDLDRVIDAVLGEDITGLDRTLTTYDFTPGMHVREFRQKFSPPVADRTLYTVGICNAITATPAASGSRLYATVATVVDLSLPCVQLSTERLDIFYRVQVLEAPSWETNALNGIGLTPWEVKSFAKALFDRSGLDAVIPYMSGSQDYFKAASIPFLNPRRLNYCNEHSSIDRGDLTNALDYTIEDVSASRRSNSGTVGYNTLIGRVITSIFTDEWRTGQLVEPNGARLQGVFGHGPASDTPFFNSLAPIIGGGAITVTEGTWPQGWAQHFVMDITTSGAVGVGQYKLKTRSSLGFIDNTFVNDRAVLNFTSNTNSHFRDDTFNYFRDDFFVGDNQYYGIHAKPIKYTDDKVVFIYNDQFCVTQIYTGDGVVFNNATLVGIDVVPKFNATDIRQVYFSATEEIYIACGDTGLYKFNADQSVVTVIDFNIATLAGTTGCYGVCIGNAGRVWAYFGHATTPTIYYSDDDGATWTVTTFNNAFLTANPGLVVGLQADPNNAGGKVSVVSYGEIPIYTSAYDLLGYWYDHATTTSTPIATRLGLHQLCGTSSSYQYGGNRHADGHNYIYSDILKCSPNSEFWATGMYKINASTYSTSVRIYAHGGEHTAEASCNYQHQAVEFTKDENGNDAVYGIGKPASPSSYVFTSVVVKSDGTYSSYESYATTTSGADHFHFDYKHSDHFCYLGDSFFLAPYSDDNIPADEKFYYIASLAPTLWADQINPASGSEVWKHYGWNGSAWELDNPNSKTIHATSDLLVQDMSIQFDDNGSGTPFLLNDRYTFGVCSGIWLDGSTTFDWEWDFYYKPSKRQTTVEASTLPGTLRIANDGVVRDVNTTTDLRDQINTTTSSDYIRNFGGTGPYPSGFRSVLPVVVGNAVLGNKPPTTLVQDDVLGVFEWEPYIGNFSFNYTHKMGLSPAYVIGTPIDHTNIKYCMSLDNNVSGDVTTLDITILLNNSVQASFPAWALVGNASYGEPKFRIAVQVDGTVVFYGQSWPSNYDTAWYEIYRTAVGTHDGSDLYIDSAGEQDSTSGNRYMKTYTANKSATDYYLYLGNGGSEGTFATDYVTLDPDHVTINIDGSLALNIGNNDTTTALTTGVYSFFPLGGYIRYSSADIGKSITAEYITVTNT